MVALENLNHIGFHGEGKVGANFLGFLADHFQVTVVPIFSLWSLSTSSLRSFTTCSVWLFLT